MWYFFLCGKCGFSEDSLIKCKQMSMGSWMKLPVQSLWKLWAPKKCLGGKRLLYVSWWKVRALRRFRDEMQTNIYGKLGESILFNLCWNCRLSKNALVECDTSIPVESASSQKIAWKLQQISNGNWMKAFCSISVDTAGSWKCLDVTKNCIDIHKRVPLEII